jgi:hypothetical protein
MRLLVFLDGRRAIDIVGSLRRDWKSRPFRALLLEFSETFAVENVLLNDTL